jgi:hypothetical protein
VTWLHVKVSCIPSRTDLRGVGDPKPWLEALHQLSEIPRLLTVRLSIATFPTGSRNLRVMLAIDWFDFHGFFKNADDAYCQEALS